MTYFPQDSEPLDRNQALNIWISTMHMAVDRGLKEIAQSNDDIHDAAALGRFLSVWCKAEEEGDEIVGFNNRSLTEAFYDLKNSIQPDPLPWIYLGQRLEFQAAVVNLVRKFRQHLNVIARLSRMPV